MPRITDVPVEVFIDVLLPLLPVSSLLRLGCTNRFFYLLTSDEPFWHRKIQEDYNFPSSDTARTTGWKFIYKRLANPKVYVWGEASHGRLGLRLLTETLRNGVHAPTHLKIPGVRIVSLVAGGMSFHAIDSKGDVYVWGVLDGTSYALGKDTFSEPSKIALEPTRLALPEPIRSLSCGRLHSAALDATGDVWNFVSWGRPFRLVSSLLDKSSPDTTPLQVECGWGFTSVLTESRDVLVWWPRGPVIRSQVQDKNTLLDESDPDSHGKLETEFRNHGKHSAKYINCHVWDLETDPVRLPPVPVHDLPQLSDTGLSHEEKQKETKLVKITAMDNFVIGLTNKGHVLRYTKLYDEEQYKNGRWEYLPYFSELAKVKECAPFLKDESSSEAHLDPPESMHITHISAHFRTFIAYSTGSKSVVLMGHMDTDDPIISPADTLKPTIHPTLQFRSVISVVLGDYHFGALTSDGKLFTWGEFSKGALGLGDPTKIPAGQPGGYATEEVRLSVVDRGFGGTPSRVNVPTEVNIEEGRETFCFAASAAGWHTGALVIDLEPDAEEHERELEEQMPGSFPTETTQPATYDDLGSRHGQLPFRVGFAGRAGFRGRGGGGVWRRASPR
ncbi:hypothetical protein QCA50_010515 [Cerrena zonata]|uniref:F-box domain-containing protein n=1 Tax=Cerrena zonata TaxID=2478898 RepID=A0AAW0FZS6_9APHY